MTRSTLRHAVSKTWKYFGLCMLLFFVYYLSFRYLISSSNGGLVLIAVPIYLVYALISTASILFTLSVYSLISSFPRTGRNGAPPGIFSAFSVFVGGVSAGCACQAPILYGMLYFLGLNSLEASGLVTSFADHENAIMEAMIAVNLILIVLFYGRIQKANGPIPTTRQITKGRDSGF